ncbi:MAG: hypothetical protein ACRD07_14585 [Acidimicrobiales bacterium]
MDRSTRATAAAGAEVVELLLPRTDGGALAQAVAAAVATTGALIAVRRNRDLQWFVGGLATLTFAWFALRTLH